MRDDVQSPASGRGGGCAAGSDPQGDRSGITEDPGDLDPLLHQRERFGDGVELNGADLRLHLQVARRFLGR